MTSTIYVCQCIQKSTKYIRMCGLEIIKPLFIIDYAIIGLFLTSNKTFRRFSVLKQQN